MARWARSTHPTPPHPTPLPPLASQAVGGVVPTWQWPKEQKEAATRNLGNSQKKEAATRNLAIAVLLTGEPLQGTVRRAIADLL
jgi:hypothetical protein